MRYALACLSLLLAACATPEPVEKDPLVETVTVGEETAAQPTLSFTGTVRAEVESDLSFRIGGVIVERYVDRGDRVVRGQPLARVDAADLRDSAIAARANAEAARREAASAAAAANLAANEERRLRGLDTAGAISVQDYQRARDQATVAREQAGAARARANAAAAQADVAGNQSGYAILRAPKAGIVADVLAEAGQVVQPGIPIIRFAAAGRREAEVDVPEAMLRAIRGGATAELFATGTQCPARLRTVDGVADPVTRTYRARFTLETSEDVPLGSSVSLSIRPVDAADAQSPAIVLPAAALVKRGDKALVYVVDPKTARVAARSVTVISLGSETVRVTGPLSKGERVVAMGGFQLRNGQKVRLSGAK